MFTLDELENNLEFEDDWQNAELDRVIDDLLLFELAKYYELSN